MLEKILADLKKISLEDLLNLREKLDHLITEKENKLENTLGDRKFPRARVSIKGEAEIEREREFFELFHKVTIHNMSVDGLSFTVPAEVIEDDILTLTFRNPSNGEKKQVHCQAIRVQQTKKNSGVECKVAAKAVDKKTVHAYRDMLRNRGR